MPESPSDVWREEFNDVEIEEMVYKLGNLTPLEPSYNREIGNSAYSEKQRLYKKSAYQITSSVEVENWTPDTINKRQEQIAKRAVHIWQADFAD